MRERAATSEGAKAAQVALHGRLSTAKLHLGQAEYFNKDVATPLQIVYCDGLANLINNVAHTAGTKS